MGKLMRSRNRFSKFLITFLFGFLVISFLGCGSSENVAPTEPIPSGTQEQFSEPVRSQVQVRNTAPISIEPTSSQPLTFQPTAIAFVRDDNIFIASEDGSQERQLTFDTKDYETPPIDDSNFLSVLSTSQFGGLCFSNSGNTIAAWKNLGNTYDLVLINSSNGKQRSLSGLTADSWSQLDMKPIYGNICWSPQDQSLFCTAKENSSNTRNVVRIDLTTGFIEMAVENAESPSLTADGKNLSCVCGSGSLLKNLESGEVTHTPDIYLGEIVYSPNVNAVSSTSREGQPDNSIEAANKDSDKSLFYSYGILPRFTHPSFSPDGNQIIFCLIMGSVSKLFIGNLEHYEGAVDYSGPVEWGEGLFPAWSPR